jgi:hypothetical protein
MQFHPSGTDPTPTALLACRNVRWNIVIILAVLWAAAIFWWCVPAPYWVRIICTALLFLLTWPIIKSWRKRGRAENWVLAIYNDGVWLNLRDCEYIEAEPANTIVFLPYHEIAAVRRVVHRYTTPSSDNDTTSYKDVYLELRLRTSDNSALKKALADERRRDPPPRSHFGGAVTSQTRRTQFPVEMEGDSAVRVKFTHFGSGYGLRPALKKVLATLEQFVTVESDEQQSTASWRELDETQFDDLVRRLATSGQSLDAIRLLRERKGLSTTAAHNFVEALAIGEKQPALE